jgi:hypothetical protein
MRELIPTAVGIENGGQWTRPGAENLLQWHQVYRHAPKRWTRWFTRSEPV